MARRRKRKAPPVIPEWVLDPVFAVEAERWLDDLAERDPEAGWEAFVEVISRPVRTEPPLG